MVTDVLASARQLRNPLTVGYAALITIWLLFGEPLSEAAKSDELGRRLLNGFASFGGAAELALITFVASIIGSVLWHAGMSRLVQHLSRIDRHPSWPALIDEARSAVKDYEQYSVTTYKGQSGQRPSAFDEKHTVPSPHWGDYLHERVYDRERKAAEMSFRVTLAVSLVPMAIALGIEGGEWWWCALICIPVVWLDVLFLKHKTLRVIRLYELEDAERNLAGARDSLKRMLEAQKENGKLSDAERKHQEAYIERLRAQICEYEATIEKHNGEARRRVTKFVEFLEGEPAD